MPPKRRDHDDDAAAARDSLKAAGRELLQEAFGVLLNEAKNANVLPDLNLLTEVLRFYRSLLLDPRWAVAPVPGRPTWPSPNLFHIDNFLAAVERLRRTED